MLLIPILNGSFVDKPHVEEGHIRRQEQNGQRLGVPFTDVIFHVHSLAFPIQRISPLLR